VWGLGSGFALPHWVILPGECDGNSSTSESVEKAWLPEGLKIGCYFCQPACPQPGCIGVASSSTITAGARASAFASDHRKSHENEKHAGLAGRQRPSAQRNPWSAGSTLPPRRPLISALLCHGSNSECQARWRNRCLARYRAIFDARMTSVSTRSVNTPPPERRWLQGTP
jgi:hypothetical protein